LAGLGKTLAAGDSPKQITQPQAALCTARWGDSWGIPWHLLGHSVAPVGAFHGAHVAHGEPPAGKPWPFAKARASQGAKATAP